MTESSAAVRSLPTAAMKFWSLGIAGLGALIYALFAFNFILPHAAPFGQSIYDQYYLSILHGRLDLSARVVGYEGHYAADGTAYLYHGVAPLLTRFAVGWLLPLGKISLAPFSIWLWAVIGTACYHVAFFDTARRSWPKEGRNPVFWSATLAFAVWFASPGPLLVANVSLYHEPIAMAYALSAIFVLIWQKSAFANIPMRQLVIAMALLAALTLHARPNLAIGLYLGTVIAAGLTLWRDRSAALPAVVAALFVLGIGGVGFLALNAIRFGSVLQSHGSFANGGVEYGPLFWGLESIDSQRAQAFVAHGSFNLERVIPNLVLYGIDLPSKPNFLAGVSDSILETYRSVTNSALGFIRVERPRLGILYLWACWFLILLAVPFASRLLKRMIGLWLATGVAALLTLAYGTVTFRYRIDIWPFIATMSLTGLAAMVPFLAKQSLRSLSVLGVVFAICISFLATVATANAVHKQFQSTDSSDFFQPWSEEHCIALSRLKGLPETRIPDICRPPYLN